MAKSGPIVIVDDDQDDQEILKDVMQELGVTNELIIFGNATDAYDYLLTTTDRPFIILCDNNLPKVSGLEFKRQIDENSYLRRKSIPFVFLSTSAESNAVNEAYTQMTVQGFFQKKASMPELKTLVELIMNYWKECYHPNA